MKDLAEVLGIHPATLHHWKKIGLVCPYVDPQGGSGTSVLFSEAQQRRAAMIVLLAKDAPGGRAVGITAYDLEPGVVKKYQPLLDVMLGWGTEEE